jgi:Ala-tRNA(Pro) deacylase
LFSSFSRNKLPIEQSAIAASDVAVVRLEEVMAMKIDEVLSSRQIPFERLHHRPAYAANRVAQVLHVPGKEMAKSVLLRAANEYILAVLPATHRVDREQLRQKLGEGPLEFASENDMDRLFPDCEPGAIPPFGSLYQMRTLVDESLTEDRRIVFEAQNHEEAISMAYQDYESLEHPVKARFARHV